MSSEPAVCFLSSMHSARDKRVFEKEARALAAAGLSVVHVCPAGSGEPVGTSHVEGVRIRRFEPHRGLIGRALGIPRLVREARKERVDVYHCNEVDSWIAGICAARSVGALVVFDVHEHYPSTFGAVHLPEFLRQSAASAIRLLFRLLSPFTHGFVFAKASVASDFKVPPGRTALVRNLPPLRLLDKSFEAATHRRTEGVVAIHTGYTGRVRGWPQLLEAVSQPDAQGLVAVLMGGFIDDSSEAFWSRVTDLGLRDRIIVEPWQPFDAAFARILQADVGLILFQPGIDNHIFASPHKLFEYMLAGLPVIAPAFAVEVADIVRRYNCGILVDPSDPHQIAVALRRLAEAPELRREMGTRGRQAVLDELNWEREVERLYGLYRRLGVNWAPE